MAYQLGTFRPAVGDAFAGVLVGEQVVPLAELGFGATTVEALLADWARSSAALDAAVSGGAVPASALALSSLTAAAPFVPNQVFQSGANYRTHVVQLMVAAAAEQGADDLDDVRARAVATMDERASSGTPYVFLGLPSAVCGPVDDVVLPPTGVQHDWELELGVVIGAYAYLVDRDRAMDCVAGYVIVNDLSTRDRIFRPDIPSLGTDWLAGKNAPTFLPLGPWVTPARFVPDPMDLRICLSLNGEVMQDESTADMIFDIPRLIEHVSAITPLRPGDLLLTGSPAGNGAHYGRYLRAGDVMEGAITGLGTQRNRCVIR
ncbi:fumarylacetoacetate hydrolase family protein [uncultured Jatrophihabitans sp.]|uniref:fumarylacetoacetate hydrolase family protein n=1 Tax=uncultured Jatrophihabitans sp. TaxID=1610747 RepID=UPI0035CADA95